MTEFATATAPIEPHAWETGEDAEPIAQPPAELDIQCVVYVGNILTYEQMRSPRCSLGGKLFPWPDFLTVKKGIVPTCEITRLRKVAYRSVHKSQIKEDQWPMWTPAYTLRNQWDPAQQRFVDITVGVDGASKDLLFKELRVSQELGRIAGKADGVIALDERCGITRGEDIKEAQLHYFPNWLEIKVGTKVLPVTLAELQAHLNDRRAAAQSASLRAIGDAYLRSCTEFEMWGKAYIAFQTGIIETTKDHPGSFVYDEISERLFTMLKVTRKDALVESFAQNQAAQAETDTTLKQSMAKLAQGIEQLSVFIASGGKLPVSPEADAPTPATLAEAAADLERAIEDDIAEVATTTEESEPTTPVVEAEDTFTDMTDITPGDDE